MPGLRPRRRGVFGIVTSGRYKWQPWGLRISALERVAVAVAASGVLWLIGAWAMDWL